MIPCHAFFSWKFHSLFRVCKESIIIGVLLEAPFHWRPLWTSRWRPPDYRWRPHIFVGENLFETSIFSLETLNFRWRSDENIWVSHDNMGCPTKKYWVSNENIGVFNENTGVSQENLGVSNENMGSPTRILRSPTKRPMESQVKEGLQRDVHVGFQ